jgi:hypothetical protein
MPRAASASEPNTALCLRVRLPEDSSVERKCYCEALTTCRFATTSSRPFHATYWLMRARLRVRSDALSLTCPRQMRQVVIRDKISRSADDDTRAIF